MAAPRKYSVELQERARRTAIDAGPDRESPRGRSSGSRTSWKSIQQRCELSPAGRAEVDHKIA